jgi:hypothetical protein
VSSVLIYSAGNGALSQAMLKVRDETLGWEGLWLGDGVDYRRRLRLHHSRGTINQSIVRCMKRNVTTKWVDDNKQSGLVFLKHRVVHQCLKFRSNDKQIMRLY